MKFKSIIFLSTVILSSLTLPSHAESNTETQATSPYVMLGCKLDTSAGFPQYITSSVTYGFNGGHLSPYNHISCGQNLERAQSYYDIVNVTSVGNEVVYTLKYKL